MTFPLSLGTPGGGTRDCRELARHLVRAGVDLTLLAASSHGPKGFPRDRSFPTADDLAAARELEEAGVRVLPVPIHPVHYLLDGLPMARAVRRLLAREHHDAVLSWWHEAALLPGVARAAGVPFVMNAAASYAPVLAPPGRKERLQQLARAVLVTKPQLRAARRVFCRSEFSRRELVELAGVDPARIRIAPCGVDPSLAAIERPPAAPVERLLFFGRFTRAKGLFDVLAALGRVAARSSAPFTLRVAGWGDEEHVRRVAREQGLAERLELLGALDREGLARELAAAQLAILPSYTESFGLANAEALTAGVPVVAYAAGAVPEVVEDGRTGWLAPRGDLEGLARAVEAALRDPEATRRAGLLGRERMLERFTWERSARLTLEGIEELWAGAD